MWLLRARLIAPGSFSFYEQLHSPQLRQSIASLVNALQTGNYNAVVTNFGLDPAAGAAKLAFGDGTSFFTLTLACSSANDREWLTLVFAEWNCDTVVGAFLDAVQHWGDQQDAAMDGGDDASGN